MSNEEFDKKIEKLTERHTALAESVELLRGSVSDLTAIVHAIAQDTKEQKERDKRHFTALASLLENWAGLDAK